MEENVIVEEEEAENDEDDCSDPPPWMTIRQAELADQLLKVFFLQHGFDTAALRSME